MFYSWGHFSYRHRRIIPVVLIGIIIAAFAVIGTKLPERMSQEGWEDPGAASTTAAKIELETFGRDNRGDVIVLFADPAEHFAEAAAYLEQLQAQHPDEIDSISSYFTNRNPNLISDDGSTAFAAIGLRGDAEQTLRDFRTIKPTLRDTDLPIQIAGATAVADALDSGMAQDIARAERAALPVVGLLLLIVFGSVVASFMPLIVGSLSILGSLAILSVLASFLQVNVFAQAVVTLLGLGLAIDYGLFMVSRFREELAKGQPTDRAVAITTATAGQTVVFSAAMVAVALSGLFLFPQAFLKSVAYGSISAVGLAAVLSVTVLPAIFGLLGHRIDTWSWRSLTKWLRQRTPATETSADALEHTWWWRLPEWAMRRAKLTTVAIVGLLIALTLPLLSVTFGGINETYLPPEQETRVAQDQFNEQFPAFRTEPVKLVVTNADNQQLVDIVLQARAIEGLTEPLSPATATVAGTTVLSAGIVDRDDYSRIVSELSDIQAPDGVGLYVGGTPAMEVESLNALFKQLPWMALYVVLATFILMALAFGSVILPAKAVLMTLLTLGATLGILSAMFIQGLGSELFNFSPGPLMSPILVLIIAIIYGLSTDYEVFLVSRMVEARKKGESTDRAILFGTAHTGGIITAAALIMIVVCGAFGFSDIVMMKYIAFGMIFALFIDATIVRMLLVPAVMHLLREDNWWAPRFIQRAYQVIGHGSGAAVPVAAAPTAAAPVAADAPVGAVDSAASAATTPAPEAPGPEAPSPEAPTPEPPAPVQEAPAPVQEVPAPALRTPVAIRGSRSTHNDDELIPFRELMARLHTEDPNAR